MGVEAGRDEDPGGPEPLYCRNDDVVEQRQIDIPCRTRRQGKVDRRAESVVAPTLVVPDNLIAQCAKLGSLDPQRGCRV